MNGHLNTLIVTTAAVLALLVPGRAAAVNLCPVAYDDYECEGLTGGAGVGTPNCDDDSAGTVTCNLQAEADNNTPTAGADVIAVSSTTAGAPDTYNFAMWGTDGDGEEFCCYFEGMSELNNTIIYGTAEYGDTIDLNDGERHLRSDTDEVYGLGGPDTISGSTVIGDAIDADDGTNTVHGFAGADTILGGDDADNLYGGEDGDTIHGYGAVDHIYGEEHDDFLYGDDNDDDIWGGSGADEAHGGAGADDICGNTGDDTMWGDGENDTLYGGGDTDYADGGSGTDDCSAETCISCISASAPARTRPPLPTRTKPDGKTVSGR